MTLVVVGLDAADHHLVSKWGLENLQLERFGRLETFAHTADTPLTAEVWPAMATGKHPEEMEQGGRRGDDWSGTLAVANRIAKLVLPQSTRTTVGRYLRTGREVDAHYGPSGGDHVFADGAVYNWPGITPAKNWSRSEVWLQRYHDGELTDLEFFRRQMALTGEELGWAAAMAGTWLPIVGTRCHALDHLGHAWAAHPDKLETAYRRIDELVETLRESPHVTDIVVCSDHGMQTTVLADDAPGGHSWRAMFATTNDDPIPDSVMGVRAWLEERTTHQTDMPSNWREYTMDTPSDRLRELGYIE